LDNANREHDKCAAGQLNLHCLPRAPVFTFHGANLTEATLSEDEAGKIFELFCG